MMGERRKEGKGVKTKDFSVACRSSSAAVGCRLGGELRLNPLLDSSACTQRARLMWPLC